MSSFAVRIRPALFGRGRWFARCVSPFGYVALFRNKPVCVYTCRPIYIYLHVPRFFANMSSILQNPGIGLNQMHSFIMCTAINIVVDRGSIGREFEPRFEPLRRDLE